MVPLEKMPLVLRKQLAGAALRLQQNAAAIYDLLDQRAGPGQG
jgi:hypothetical protein